MADPDETTPTPTPTPSSSPAPAPTSRAGEQLRWEKHREQLRAAEAEAAQAKRELAAEREALPIRSTMRSTMRRTSRPGVGDVVLTTRGTMKIPPGCLCRPVRDLDGPPYEVYSDDEE